ncbi:MAG: TonB-dependent receptor plug domain-containing protein [Planctomycetaceae bacterium]|nr:TonB-dependent receptor plug domain-containing protein [Planctomycetaceae bacterium]
MIGASQKYEVAKDDPRLTLRRTPAAAFVITPEMIRRSGARSIPELLRMVPGLYVARIDANKWSISSRSFSTRFVRNLLVQIDGRTVYTPLFGGTFWDVQDVLLKDIERIEVIRGPGATIWGENAVNGVINIITKSSTDTQGTYVEAGGGTEQRGFTSFRHGGKTQNDGTYRVYGKWFERDTQYEPNGNAHDDWRQGRFGFRMDWDDEMDDRFTFQGDTYFGSNGIANQQPFVGLGIDDEPVSGSNLLTRWTHDIDQYSDSTVQFYYDRNDRNTLGFDQALDTIDIDWQYRTSIFDRHEIVAGLGYRSVWSHLQNDSVTPVLSSSPEQRNFQLFSAFIQDEYELRQDSLYLTVGTKIGENTFTNTQVQPNIRLLWLTDENSSAWAAVSRAVRIPSIIENDGRLIIDEFMGNPVYLNGSSNLIAETMIAYEVGYRSQPTESFAWDLALFYNTERKIGNFRAVGGPTELELFRDSNLDSFGLELAAQLEMTENWRLFGWYSFLRSSASTGTSALVSPLGLEEGAPRHQAFLMSSWDLTENVDLDVLTRFVDNVPQVPAPAYMSMDCRVAWRPRENMELSLVGQNLLDSHHKEYDTSIFVKEVPTQVQRGMYAMFAMEF